MQRLGIIISAATIAAVVGCGSSGGKTASSKGAAPTTLATASPSPTTEALDAKARLACTYTDDALNQYLGAQADHIGATARFWEAETAAYESKSADLAKFVLHLSFEKTPMPDSGRKVRDWCIQHGWQSAFSG